MAEARKVLGRKAKGKWKLEGYDTFSEKSYPLDGEFLDEEAARNAAKLRLKKLEKIQPTELTGGQVGVQDRVYIIRPDGTKHRFIN